MMVAIDAYGLVVVLTLTVATAGCVALINLVGGRAWAKLVYRRDWEVTLVQHHILRFKHLT